MSQNVAFVSTPYLPHCKPEKVKTSEKVTRLVKACPLPQISRPATCSVEAEDPRVTEAAKSGKRFTDSGCLDQDCIIRGASQTCHSAYRGLVLGDACSQPREPILVVSITETCFIVHSRLADGSMA